MRRGLRIIQDTRDLASVDSELFDYYLRRGWRNHGQLFFRYNMAIMDGRMHLVLPLRIHVPSWEPTASQKRILRRNADLRGSFHPAQIDAERRALFQRHAQRFPIDGRPLQLEDFLGKKPWASPCRGVECVLRDNGKLAAFSYGFVGADSFSSVYAVFDPRSPARSLGIHTMLGEIVWAREQGLTWYYPGYATYHPSLYDYKKAFHALQYYDWEERWHPLPKGGFVDGTEAPKVADLRNTQRS